MCNFLVRFEMAKRICNRLCLSGSPSVHVQAHNVLVRLCTSAHVQVKMWARKQRINDPANGSFNSYALSLMALFHLQSVSPPVMPNLEDLLDDERPLEGGYIRDSNDGLQKIRRTCQRFSRSGFGLSNELSTAELFLSFIVRFMALTQAWDSGSATSVRMSTYHGMLLDARFEKDHIVLVEDPFDSTDNAARTLGTWSSPSGAMRRVMNAFRRSAQPVLELEGKACVTALVRELFGNLAALSVDFDGMDDDAELGGSGAAQRQADRESAAQADQRKPKRRRRRRQPAADGAPAGAVDESVPQPQTRGVRRRRRRPAAATPGQGEGEPATEPPAAENGAQPQPRPHPRHSEESVYDAELMHMVNHMVDPELAPPQKQRRRRRRRRERHEPDVAPERPMPMPEEPEEPDAINYERGAERRVSRGVRRAMNELRDEVRGLAYRSVDAQDAAPCVPAPGLCCPLQRERWRASAGPLATGRMCSRAGSVRAPLSVRATVVRQQGPRVRLRVSAASSRTLVPW